jgi:2-hydroxychromene-2-carboxylate isomerase
MTRTVEFLFDAGSPTAYLAWTQLPKVCAKSGARLVCTPMLLGGVFQATGNVSPAAVPPKGNCMAAAGFDPAAMQALVAEPVVKNTLRAHTEAAVARGVFGAPTMFVGETMSFGQDRLDFVREALL